ncbi:MAG TPA: c-type cytochrome, partial [Candidatus Angelobacter sp.]|nr:c-type cytochrome [Candidatus Angelobacter sp.]
LTLTAFLAGCTARRKPLPLEKTVANMVKDVAIPIEARAAKDPLGPSAETIDAGKLVFMQHCALCHGVDGRGYTSLGRSMFPPSMDLNSPHVQHWTAAEIFWIVQNGISFTGMPSWRSIISPEDTWRIAHFIHALPQLNAEKESSAPSETALQEQPGDRASEISYGRTLYHQEGCFMCHQLDGQGGKVGPDLTIEGTRGRTDEWLIGHFRNPPAYTPGSIMPPFKNLTGRQLQALTTFLQSQKGKKQ